MPSSAAWTRSMPYFSRASNWSSAPAVVIFLPPRMSSMDFVATFLVSPAPTSSSLTGRSSYSPISRWSSESSASPLDLADCVARWMSCCRDELSPASSGAGVWLGFLRSRRCSPLRMVLRSMGLAAVARATTRAPIPSSLANNTTARWSGSACEWPLSFANDSVSLMALIAASVMLRSVIFLLQ